MKLKSTEDEVFSKDLDAVDVPAFKKNERPDRDSSEDPFSKLKLLTGEEQYPFRVREIVTKKKVLKMPKKLTNYNDVMVYLTTTQEVSSEIMKIIHYIADNNIDNTYYLDKLCKRTLKLITELIGHHEREF